jgi:DNA-binding transcriptional MocR family regulator
MSQKTTKPTAAERVATLLRKQIAGGTYRVGEKLPSIRTLATEMSVSKNCVVEAFELLAASGEVEPHRGSGHYVSSPRAPARTEQEPHTYAKLLDTVWLMREQLNNDPKHLPVGHGIPPGHWLSSNRLERAHKRIAKSSFDSMFQYGNRYGHRPLRELLERRLSTLGIEARVNQIVLTFGANEALDIVIRGLMRFGDVALVDEPGYYPLYGKLQLHGVNIVGVRRNADGPDVGELERLIKATGARLFFTQSLGQNPTGSDTSPAVAFRMLQLAEKHDITIVESDPLADLKPASMTRAATLDQLKRTIYIGSFTKSVAASMRVGFIAAAADIAERLADVKMLVHVSTSEYTEKLVEAVLRAPEYPRQIADLRDQAEQASRQATQILANLGAELFCAPSHSLYLWARLPWAPDSLLLARSMLKDQIAMAPGAVFAIDSTIASPWSRYNVGYVVDPRFAKAMERRRSAFESKRSSK